MPLAVTLRCYNIDVVIYACIDDILYHITQHFNGQARPFQRICNWICVAELTIVNSIQSDSMNTSISEATVLHKL